MSVDFSHDALQAEYTPRDPPERHGITHLMVVRVGGKGCSIGFYLWFLIRFPDSVSMSPRFQLNSAVINPQIQIWAFESVMIPHFGLK